MHVHQTPQLLLDQRKHSLGKKPSPQTFKRYTLKPLTPLDKLLKVFEILTIARTKVFKTNWHNKTITIQLPPQQLQKHGKGIILPLELQLLEKAKSIHTTRMNGGKTLVVKFS